MHLLRDLSCKNTYRYNKIAKNVFKAIFHCDQQNLRVKIDDIITWQASMRHVALILIWNSHFQGTVEITGAKRSMFEVLLEMAKRSVNGNSVTTQTLHFPTSIYWREGLPFNTHIQNYVSSKEPMHFKFLYLLNLFYFLCSIFPRQENKTGNLSGL